MKEEIIKILLKEFEDVYCDTCNGKNCEDCIRRSMGWSLDYHRASYIADKILNNIRE